MSVPANAPNAPTYNRQKLLLFLIDSAGGRLSKLDIQKLLFLFVQESGKSHYAFVPYRFGSYSFQASDDLELLQKRGWLTISDKHITLSADLDRYSWPKKSPERAMVRRWIERNPLRGDDLIRQVYRLYPYYAIRSDMKERLLTSDELEAVRKAGFLHSEPKRVLFTLGYEGRTVEDYINQLIRNGITHLCDVRLNPLSRKFGFSKSSLSTMLPKFNIEYSHVPELGVESEQRRQLSTPSQYNALFREYRSALPGRKEGLEKVRALVKSHDRLALTCYEREHQTCHRHCVSDHFSQEFGTSVVHL